MKKRILAVSLTVAMMLSMFAACSDDTATDTSTDSSTDSSADASTDTDADAGLDIDAIEVPDEIDLYVYYADASIEFVDYALEYIAEIWPDLTVNIEHRSDADGTVLQTRAAVGELPDAFECVSAVNNTLHESGDLAVLDDTIEAMDYYSRFDDTAFDGKSIDGTVYAINVSNPQAYTVFYNKTVLAENGIEEPTNYDEFYDAVVTLDEAGLIPFALFGAEQWPGLQLYDLAVVGCGETAGLTGLDTGVSAITDEAYTEAAEKLEALVEAGLYGSGALSTNASQAFELMELGQAGFMGNGSWYFQDCADYGDNIGYLEYNPFADAGEENNTAKSGGAPEVGGYAASATGDIVDFAEMFVLEFVAGRHAGEYVYSGGPCRLLEVPETDFEMSEAYTAYCEAVSTFTSTTQYAAWGLVDTELSTYLCNYTEALGMGTTDSASFIADLIDEIG